MRALTGLAWPLLISVSLIPAALSAQISFIEVAGESGIGGEEVNRPGFGGGIAAADFDDDGHVDLFVPTGVEAPDLLYRNLGGHFEEVAAARGLASMERGRSALWLDYNGDQRLDLLVASDCHAIGCADDLSYLHLYRQTGSGEFVDVTSEAGLLDMGRGTEEHRGGSAAGDVNGDGYLDLVISYWKGELSLYLNQGDGTFTDVSLAVGLDASILGHHQTVMQDFNGDGLLDFYTAVDFTENRLWINQGVSGGMPSFLDVAGVSGCDNAMNDMGVALGDFDDDGDPDFYVTNIFRNERHNVLLRNDSVGGTPVCTEVSLEAGVRDGAWGWGTTFLDVDNDGFLDLAETNGWRRSAWLFPPRLFINQGDNPPTFVDQAPDAGLTDTTWGSSLLAFDYDRDGDQDLVQALRPGPLALYQNQLDASPGDRHYLVIRPRMAGPNTRAIGAKVAVEVEGRTMTRWITAGTSYLGQEPAEAFFGLGAATRADVVTISWPDGRETVLSGVPADQVQTVMDDGIFADGFESGDTLGW